MMQFREVARITHDLITVINKKEARDQLLTEINGEPRYPAGEVVKRAGRVIVKMEVAEDPSVVEAGTTKNYEKIVRAVQEEQTTAPVGPLPSNEVKTTPSVQQVPQVPRQEGGLLKNMIDKLSDRLTAHEASDITEHSKLHAHDKIAFTLGGLGLAGLIIALILVAMHIH